MSWDVGIIRLDLPPGATNIADLVGDPLPIGARSEVEAALSEAFSRHEGAASADWRSWECDTFAVELHLQEDDDGQVNFVGVTPRGDAPLAIEPVFTFAERFRACVFAFSSCEILTRETALADWEGFRAYRDRIYPGGMSRPAAGARGGPPDRRSSLLTAARRWLRRPHQP